MLYEQICLHMCWYRHGIWASSHSHRSKGQRSPNLLMLAYQWARIRLRFNTPRLATRAKRHASSWNSNFIPSQSFIVKLIIGFDTILAFHSQLNYTKSTQNPCRNDSAACRHKFKVRRLWLGMKLDFCKYACLFALVVNLGVLNLRNTTSASY